MLLEDLILGTWCHAEEKLSSQLFISSCTNAFPCKNSVGECSDLCLPFSLLLSPSWQIWIYVEQEFHTMFLTPSFCGHCRWVAKQQLPSSSTSWQPITTGFWWKGFISTASSSWLFSQRRSISGDSRYLAGVSRYGGSCKDNELCHESFITSELWYSYSDTSRISGRIIQGLETSSHLSRAANACMRAAFSALSELSPALPSASHQH